MGLGRGRDPVPRIRGAHRRAVATLSDEAVFRGRAHRPPAPLARLAGAPRDAPAVPQRDLHSSAHRHSHRRRTRFLRPRQRGAYGGRGCRRPPRAERRQRRLRHSPRGRRHEREPDSVQRRVARHSVRARVLASDDRHLRRLLCDRHCGWRGPAGDARVVAAPRHRYWRRDPEPRVHGAAAQARLPRAGRDRRRARVRAAHAARRVRRPVGRRAVVGAVRRLDPRRATRRADPVRERDPRPAW